MKQKRKILNVRMSIEEYERLKKSSKTADISVSELIRMYAQDAQIKRIMLDIHAPTELLSLFTRIAHLLNQVARGLHHARIHSYISEINIYEAMEKINKIQELIAEERKRNTELWRQYEDKIRITHTSNK